MERRLIGALEARASQAGSMKVSGYAARYGVLSSMLGDPKSGAQFRERITSRAFESSLKTSDPVALFNHDNNKVLGRLSAGTLRLASDSTGLRFECDLPDASYARDLYQSVKRGDINGCSFGFVGAEDAFDEEDCEDEGGQRSRCIVRTIRSFGKLTDISLVTSPAYPGTSVDARHELVAAEVRMAVQNFGKRDVMDEIRSSPIFREFAEGAHKFTTRRRRLLLNL